MMLTNTKYKILRLDDLIDLSPMTIWTITKFRDNYDKTKSLKK